MTGFRGSWRRPSCRKPADLPSSTRSFGHPADSDAGSGPASGRHRRHRLPLPPPWPHPHVRPAHRPMSWPAARQWERPWHGRSDSARRPVSGRCAGRPVHQPERSRECPVVQWERSCRPRREPGCSYRPRPPAPACRPTCRPCPAPAPAPLSLQGSWPGSLPGQGTPRDGVSSHPRRRASSSAGKRPAPGPMRYVSRKASMPWLSPEKGKNPAEWPGKLSPHYTIRPGRAAEALPEGTARTHRQQSPSKLRQAYGRRRLHNPLAAVAVDVPAAA